MTDPLRGQGVLAPRGRAPGVRVPGGARTWLKWHKLRRHPAQAPCLRENLTDGLALGASMEVDIRLAACGNFVCLHDEHLDEETTGSGPVSALDAPAIGALYMRAPDGTPTQSPPLLLSQVVELIQATPRPTGAARLQLDLKEEQQSLGPAICERFAATVAPVAADLLLSAYDWDAINLLGGGIAGLALGYDPSHEAKRWDFAKPDAAQEFCRFIADHADGAAMIYLYYRIVADLLDDGFDIIAALHKLGFSVDCWTIDVGQADTKQALQRCLAAGTDQITTNSPIALEELAFRILGTA
ncbi:MAG: glycerophosphodiester phosphodiesterase [Alphaproteobacteria bacterium]